MQQSPDRPVLSPRLGLEPTSGNRRKAGQKALLLALLEPSKQLREAEANGNLTARLALLEEAKSLARGAVWDEFCLRNDVPVGAAWLAEAAAYGETAARLRS